MRPPRTRRVKAQRKFAQGAYVPPNVSVVATAENRRDTSQDARNVTINHMTAPNLLDVVSLQRVHSTLKRPVVLIERLRGQTPCRGDPQPSRSHENARFRHSECHRDNVNDNTSKIKKPAEPPRLLTVQKKRDYTRTHAMSLRSRRLSKLELNRLMAESCMPLTKAQLRRKRKLYSDDDEPLILQVSPRKKTCKRKSSIKLNGTANKTISNKTSPNQNTSKGITPKKIVPKGITPKEIAPKDITFKEITPKEKTRKEITPRKKRPYRDRPIYITTKAADKSLENIQIIDPGILKIDADSNDAAVTIEILDDRESPHGPISVHSDDSDDNSITLDDLITVHFPNNSDGSITLHSQGDPCDDSNCPNDQITPHFPGNPINNSIDEPETPTVPNVVHFLDNPVAPDPITPGFPVATDNPVVPPVSFSSVDPAVYEVPVVSAVSKVPEFPEVPVVSDDSLVVSCSNIPLLDLLRVHNVPIVSNNLPKDMNVPMSFKKVKSVHIDDGKSEDMDDDLSNEKSDVKDYVVLGGDDDNVPPNLMDQRGLCESMSEARLKSPDDGKSEDMDDDLSNEKSDVKDYVVLGGDDDNVPPNLMDQRGLCESMSEARLKSPEPVPGPSGMQSHLVYAPERPQYNEFHGDDSIDSENGTYIMESTALNLEQEQDVSQGSENTALNLEQEQDISQGSENTALNLEQEQDISQGSENSVFNLEQEQDISQGSENTALNLEQGREISMRSEKQNALPVTCITAGWRDVRDAINAPEELLESRCKVCKTCIEVEKLMQISKILRTSLKNAEGTSFNIVPTVPGNAHTEREESGVEEVEADNVAAAVLPREGQTDAPMVSSHESQTEAPAVPPRESQTHLHLDLLPNNPSLMMKVKTHMVHGKDLLSVSLLPRRREKHRDFSFQEKGLLPDQQSRTLSISVKEKTVDHRMSLSSNNIGETGPNRIVTPKEPEEPQPPHQSQEPQEESDELRRTVTNCLKNVPVPTGNSHVNTVQKAVNRVVTLIETELSQITKERTNNKVGKFAHQGCIGPPNKDNVTQLDCLKSNAQKLMWSDAESDPRMREVDDMAKALDKEKDAKSMCTGESSNSDQSAPGTSGFSQLVEGGTLVDAPVYYPTHEEFEEPFKFFDKIWPEAVQYGICKVVPPPDWDPPCRVDDDIRFVVTNQHISRLFSRWGPAARELSAIKLCLQQQKVNFSKPPLLDGVEVNLPKLYHLVQRHGGLETVINKKRWIKVAEDLKFSKAISIERKLDQIYVKYLLPYDTLSHQERQEILRKVEMAWNRKNQKLLNRAMNPLFRQKRMLAGLMESSDDETEDEDAAIAVNDAEDCIIKGNPMTLGKFKKIATMAFDNAFGQGSEARPPPGLNLIEEKYWRHVTLGTDPLCVHTAAIDTGEQGYGFPKNHNEPYGRHPFNPKMISQHARNVLRYLGPVLGLTVPTLLLGMLFSTSCWHKDPHILPWLEYQHKGPERIWYGVPSHQASNFRKAVETVCPTFCQNKGLWLSTDITMIPPQVLREHNVTLSRLTQSRREYIVAFPNAYTCCISTGYTESESVYFAPPSWLHSLWAVFKEARESCEPTMFAMEHLLFNICKDPTADIDILKMVQPLFDRMLREEISKRQLLQERGLPVIQDLRSASTSRKKSKSNPFHFNNQAECEYCRATLFLSKVKCLTGNNSILCLEHALKLLDTDVYNEDVPGLAILVHVSVKELNIVFDDVSRRTGIPIV